MPLQLLKYVPFSYFFNKKALDFACPLFEPD